MNQTVSLQRYHIADKVSSVEGFFNTNAKQTCAQLAQDDTITVEQLRLMALSVGASLDCFFSMSSANTHGKTKAKPFHTKQDIIQQLFIQNRNVRFQVAHQKYKTNKKTSKHTKTKRAKHVKHDGGKMMSQKSFEMVKGMVSHVIPQLLKLMNIPYAEQILTTLDNMVLPLSEMIMFGSDNKSSSNDDDFIALQDRIEQNNITTDEGINGLQTKIKNELLINSNSKIISHQIKNDINTLKTKVDTAIKKKTDIQTKQNKENWLGKFNTFKMFGQATWILGSNPLLVGLGITLSVVFYFHESIMSILFDSVEDEDEDSYERKQTRFKQAMDRIKRQKEEATLSFKIKKVIQTFKLYLKKHSGTALCTIPIILSGLYSSNRYTSLRKLSESIYNDPKLKIDTIHTSMNPEWKSYADTRFCLKGIDPVLHRIFKKHTKLSSIYYHVCFEQNKRRTHYTSRAILNSHLIRSDGSVRDSVAEIAVAISSQWKKTNILGIASSRLMNLFNTRKSSYPVSHESVSSDSSHSRSGSSVSKSSSSRTSSSKLKKHATRRKRLSHTIQKASSQKKVKTKK